VRYGQKAVCIRLAYRWLYTITKAFVDHSGVVPEKFNVVISSHKSNAEYGNVGVDFECVPKEGFGWMNASYKIGLRYLGVKEIRKLGVLAHPSQVFKSQ
jgi:alpha,alpha-trehalase